MRISTKMVLHRNVSLTIVCVLLGVILTWQFQSISTNSELQKYDTKRLEDITIELVNEKRKNDDYRKRNEQLEQEKLNLENTRGSNSLYEENLKNELEKARILAGLVDVKGKGIILTLDNSDFGYVEDRDLLDVVNELKASEAQAICINDERIVASTEIREAGNYIVINGKQMISPYIIKAIADPSKLENALKVVGGVAENFQQAYKLKFNIEKSEEVFIPKVNSVVIKTDELKPVENK